MLKVIRYPTGNNAHSLLFDSVGLLSTAQENQIKNLKHFCSLHEDGKVGSITIMLARVIHFLSSETNIID